MSGIVISSDALGDVLSLLIWLIFPAVLFIGSKAVRPSPKRKVAPKTRAQREADLRREYGCLVAPRSGKQARIFGKIDARNNSDEGGDETYNENERAAAAWTVNGHAYISAEGHKVDVATNRVIEYNVARRRK